MASALVIEAPAGPNAAPTAAHTPSAPLNAAPTAASIAAANRCEPFPVRTTASTRPHASPTRKRMASARQHTSSAPPAIAPPRSREARPTTQAAATAKRVAFPRRRMTPAPRFMSPERWQVPSTGTTRALARSKGLVHESHESARMAERTLLIRVHSCNSWTDPIVIHRRVVLAGNSRSDAWLWETVGRMDRVSNLGSIPARPLLMKHTLAPRTSEARTNEPDTNA